MAWMIILERVPHVRSKRGGRARCRAKHPWRLFDTRDAPVQCSEAFPPCPSESTGPAVVAAMVRKCSLTMVPVSVLSDVICSL
jgi:hypothetical protein